MDNYKKRIGIVGMIALTGMMLVGCASSAKATGNTPKGDEIPIGLDLELTGAAASYGQVINKGIVLATDEINAKGGVDVNGKKMKLKLITKDNTTNATEAATIASSLASSDKVSAIIGTVTSGTFAAALPKATTANVAMLTPTGTADNLTQQKNGGVQPYGFRTCYVNSYQGKIIAKFAQNDLKAKSAVILGDKTSDYSAGLIKAFENEFKGKIVSKQYYQAGDKDFNATITKLKSEKFDVLFVPGYYNEAGLIIKQAREAGIKAAILGPDGFADDNLLKLAGRSNVTDVYFTNHFDAKAPANGKVKPFVDAFKKKYNVEPSTFSALGYDSLYMIKQAIENEKSTNSIKIKDGLAKIKDFEGVTGTMTMDKLHDPTKDVIVVGYQNGKEITAKAVK